VSKTLDRRTILRGAGRVAVALPLLDAMLDGNGEALAQTGEAPKMCYAGLFCGQATTKDNDVAGLKTFVPSAFGVDYAPTPAFAALAQHGDVRKHVSLVSNLEIPWVTSGAVPPGGWTGIFHTNGKGPVLTGTTDFATSVDQLIADAIGTKDPFKVLTFCAQASWYLNGDDNYGRDCMSYRAGTRQAPQKSPRAAFQSLFGNFIPTDDATSSAQAAAALVRRRSILDLIMQDRDRLLKDLGASDKERVAKHLDEVRALEKRLAAAPPETTATCQKPADPGPDPAVAAGIDDATDGLDTTRGYSHEFERARIFCDLIHMAFACDLSHAATLMITTFQTHMLAHAIDAKIKVDIHELGHLGEGTTTLMREVIAWHVDHYAYLVAKLASTQEGARTLLDRSVIVFQQEAGAGGSPEGSDKSVYTHSTENMAMLVASGSLSGLKAGEHIDGGKRHTGEVLLAAAQAVAGTAVPKFGVLTTPLAVLKKG
jgi:hypothetical protein